MDLRATKEKLALPIKSAEYRVGVDDFMVYATRSLTSSDGKLRCPCIKCVNNKLLSPDDVNYHLLHFGIMRNYNNWTFHGEVVDEISFEPMNQIESIVAEQGDKEMNLDDDPVLKVLGKDQYDRVRGLGLGAKPSNFAEISAPPYCTGLNLSSKDERAVFYHLRQLKGWTQRLNKRVKRQDTTIKKLKSKLQSQFGSDFDDSDFNNSDSGSSDFDEDDDFNIHGVDK
ncbi:FACT complex subunit POB3, partial [Bienertia sinuspersici]